MLFKSLLLLLLQVTIDTRTISIKNQCDHDVWFERYNEDPTPTVIHVPEGSSYAYNSTDDKDFFEMLALKTGCNEKGADCEIGDPKPHLSNNKSCYHAPISMSILLQSSLSQKNISKGTPVDVYAIFIDDGYIIPIKVSVDSQDNCEDIRCNMTLEECPSEEINGTGDLRIKVNGETVACMAPCVTETSRGICKCATTENTIYHELIDSKCPSEPKKEDFNKRVAARKMP